MDGDRGDGGIAGGLAAAGAADMPVDVPLVVDLDGTLTPSDSLHEAAIACVVARPGTLLSLPGWLREGPGRTKAEIAAREIATGLPIRPEVAALLAEARAAGRTTVLATAAHRRQAEAVAAETGLFDEVIATGDGTGDGTGEDATGNGGSDAGSPENLKGAAKAAALVARYGREGFDYAGDATADLAVWVEARHVITVGAGEGLRARAEDIDPAATHLAPADRSARRRAWIRALRPHQWSKNLLVFLPALAAHAPGALVPALAAFVAFSLTASSVYLINDLSDLAADRAHPRKRARPFASGALPPSHGVIAAPILILLATLIGGLIAGPAFLLTLAAYYVATFAYSLWLKRKLVIDVITLAGLYTIRIIAGAAAASVVLSPWMLGFSMFLFLALAAVKRQGELADQMKDGRSGAGRAYEPEDLPVLRGIALASAHAAVLVLALYISSDDVALLYGRPEALWLVCPILLYWALRMVMKAHRGLMTDDPIVFSVTDGPSRYMILAAVLAVLVAL